MAESEKSGGLAAGLAHAAAEFAHTPFPYLLGMGLMFMGAKWDGHFHDQKGCYQLQEIKGAVYKVDSCFGKVEQVKPEATQPPTSPAQVGVSSPTPVAK